MMKKTLSTACLVCALAMLTSCGGTKTPNVTAAPTHQEFDPQTGAWRPLSKKVTAPPSKPGAVIVEQKKPGMMQKIGDTMKKPLKWVGLGKDEPKPEAKP